MRKKIQMFIAVQNALCLLDLTKKEREKLEEALKEIASKDLETGWDTLKEWTRVPRGSKRHSNAR